MPRAALSSRAGTRLLLVAVESAALQEPQLQRLQRDLKRAPPPGSEAHTSATIALAPAGIRNLLPPAVHAAATPLALWQAVKACAAGGEVAADLQESWLQIGEGVLATQRTTATEESSPAHDVGTVSASTASGTAGVRSAAAACSTQRDISWGAEGSCRRPGRDTQWL